MISTLYSFTNYISAASSHAFFWIKDHEKQLTAISSIAIAILSLWGSVNVNRFNPDLATFFVFVSSCSLICALHILGSEQVRDTDYRKNSSDYSSDYWRDSPDYSSDRDFSSDDSSNDNWIDFDD